MGAAGKFVSGIDTGQRNERQSGLLFPPKIRGNAAMSGRMRERKFSCPHGVNGNIKVTAAALVAPVAYDPGCHPIKSKEDLLELMQRSRESGQPLFINQSYTSIACKEQPELAALLFDSTQFQHTRLLGIESMFDRDVFCYLRTSGKP